MLVQKIKMMFMLSVGVLLLSGCGTDTKTDTVLVQTSAPASTYLVEYIPGMMSAEGKTAFQIRVRDRLTSNPTASLSMKLIPLMHMAGGMNHSTPVDVIMESPAGTYNCSAYYLMASGAGMGYWELQVNIGTETTTFYPSVAMAMMGSDTTYALLYGPADIVSSMSGTQYNKYYLFNDGIVSAVTPTVKLYLSHALDMKMTFKPVSAVSSPTGTVSSVLVTASTDTAFSVSASVVASDDGNGHYSMPFSSLSTTGTYTVYIKLQVNSEDKTTNGTAAAGTNAYQSFKITSH